MNYIYVRTRLHAIIAIELIKINIIKKPYSVIIIHQHSSNEDSRGVYFYFSELTSEADYVYTITQSKGLWWAFLITLKTSLHALFSNGHIYAATIDFYPLAMAIKICPLINFNTFDDGAANTESDISQYFSLKPLGGFGFKKSFAKILFPLGSAFYLRGRINKHYTIYPGLPNIVDLIRCINVNIDWLNYLRPSDAKRLFGNEKIIILGTVYNEVSRASGKINQVLGLMELCDVYIPHPRDNSKIKHPKVFEITSPAEAIICFLKMRNNLVVYHFQSSVELSFLSDESVSFIKLDNIN